MHSAAARQAEPKNYPLAMVAPLHKGDWRRANSMPVYVKDGQVRVQFPMSVIRTSWLYEPRSDVSPFSLYVKLTPDQRYGDSPVVDSQPVGHHGRITFDQAGDIGILKLPDWDSPRSVRRLLYDNGRCRKWLVLNDFPTTEWRKAFSPPVDSHTLGTKDESTQNLFPGLSS